MLKTILLLDGSEAMNSSADYLPSYLLAMRPPLLKLTSHYLDATPLASLGIVVMRNGVADRLCPCTTNASDLADTLERDYFLYGGAGVTSLENGLRMALSELVDLRRLAAPSKQQQQQQAGASTSPAAAAQQSGVAKLRIIIVSASVTFIDPTDVLRVIATMAAFRVVIDVVSLTGAVHVFDECARQTGGHLYCPMGYDHLVHIMHQLVVGKSGGRRLRSRGKRPRTGGASEEDKAPMVPIGFPVYVSRDAAAGGGQAGAGVTRYLACPQCHLIQSSIPSTCPLCKLLLCNVSLTYSTSLAHNNLVPASTEIAAEGGEAEGGGGDAHCSMCCEHRATSQGSGPFYRCDACRNVRCARCEFLVRETFGLCPGCVASM